MMEVVQDVQKASPVFAVFSCIFSPLSLCFIEPFTVFNGFTQAEKKNMLGNHIILGAAHLPRLGNRQPTTKREVDPV